MIFSFLLSWEKMLAKHNCGSVVSTSRVLPLAPPATWVFVTTLFLSFALVSSLAFALLLMPS